MGRTKKIGAAGKFGPRYGTKLRKLVSDVERKLKQPHKCPSCGAMKVQRVSTAIWQCRRCGVKIAGAAYVPSMPIAKPLEKKIEVENKAKEGS
jgi:large subunit ribosomal protein L37Ae